MDTRARCRLASEREIVQFTRLLRQGDRLTVRRELLCWWLVCRAIRFLLDGVTFPCLAALSDDCPQFPAAERVVVVVLLTWQTPHRHRSREVRKHHVSLARAVSDGPI